MPLTVEATYENGTLKLSQPLPLREYEKVQVTVHIGPTWAERTAGMMGGTGSTEAADYFAMSPELDYPIPEEEP
jgi:predicted DNA-binding antitoxin AbrB/MazE fold protein